MYVTSYIFKVMWVGYGELEVCVLNNKIWKVKGAGPTNQFLDKEWSDVLRRDDMRDEEIIYAS